MYYHEQVLRDGSDHLTRHFTIEEMACKCCGLVKLAPFFMSQLEALRMAVGFVLPISSGCRCQEHNEEEDGRYGSFHLTVNPKYSVDGTCAVDVYWAKWKDSKRVHLIQMARVLGWSIGKSNSFCHLDKRQHYTNKPRVEFLYPGYKGV